MDDYNDLFTMGWAEIPEESLIPAGHWNVRVSGMAYYAPKEEGKSGQLKFFYNPVEPLGDVSSKELKALGDYDYTQNEVGSKPFFVSNIKDFRAVRAHLEKHSGHNLSPSQGIFIVAEDGSRKIDPEFRKAFIGAHVQALVTIDEYKGEQQNVATSFAPLES